MQQLRSKARSLKSHALVGAFIIVSILIAGCSTTPNDSSLTASNSATASPLPTQDKVDSASISSVTASSTLPAKISGAALDSAPRAGTCGNITEEPGGKRFRPAACEASVYRVAQAVDMPNDCPVDVDQKIFYGSPSESVFYSLCLDISWQAGKCLQLNSSRGAVVPCRASETETFYPTRAFRTPSPDSCLSDVERQYTSRGFKVCVNRVR